MVSKHQDRTEYHIQLTEELLSHVLSHAYLLTSPSVSRSPYLVFDLLYQLNDLTHILITFY